MAYVQDRLVHDGGSHLMELPDCLDPFFDAKLLPRFPPLAGFSSQLVFTTFCLNNFGLNQGKDMELAYAAASAHNKMMTDFCAVDERFLATAIIPLEVFEGSAALKREAIAVGGNERR